MWNYNHLVLMILHHRDDKKQDNIGDVNKSSCPTKTTIGLFYIINDVGNINIQNTSDALGNKYS